MSDKLATLRHKLDDLEVNIFVLDKDIVTCAQYHTDKHVVKMILETAQLLSTAHRVLDGDVGDSLIYRKTHVNHPCGIWVRQTEANYRWAYNLFVALCDEYTYRYDKIHLSWTKLGDVLKVPPINIPTGDLTPFALAMPDDYKTSDPVESYRQYYLGNKRHLFKWKKRRPPSWIC